jgi:hypothetical protein
MEEALGVHEVESLESLEHDVADLSFIEEFSRFLDVVVDVLVQALKTQVRVCCLT